MNKWPGVGNVTTRDMERLYASFGSVFTVVRLDFMPLTCPMSSVNPWKCRLLMVEEDQERDNLGKQENHKPMGLEMLKDGEGKI